MWRSDGTDAGTFLLKDITPGDGWSYFLELTDVGGTLYFIYFPDSSSQLWKTDGTEAGTESW